MTKHKATVVIEADTKDVLEAEQILRKALEESNMNPHSDLEGFRIGDVLNLDVYTEEVEAE